MTKVIVFAGPTLPSSADRTLLDATYLPPAAQGDLFKAAEQHQPDVIGIIDGYFHLVPSVRHKEVLWAMAEGIHVFGSASMGALRAAELSVFGMVGVGKIYKAYASGELTDDDEVAVIHGPEALGFPALSDAMVDVRATLKAAVDASIISPATERHLTIISKTLFFQDRSYGRIIEAAMIDGPLKAELKSLEDWLPDGKISQKRDDALLMLRTIDDFMTSLPPKKRVAYFLEETYSFEKK